MKAQEVINSIETKEEEDNLKFFYPEIYKQRQADKNITRILKGDKNENIKLRK